MAIALVGSSQFDTGSSPAATPNTPTGTQDGHVMIGLYGNGQDDGTSVIGAGYTTIGSVESATGTRGTIWMGYKVADSEGATQDFDYTSTSSNQTSAIVATFSGVDVSSPLDVSYTSSHYVKTLDDPTPLPQPITTVTNGAVVITGAWWQLTGTTAVTPSSGYTEIEEIIPGVGTRYAHMQYKEVTSAGLESPGVFTAVNGEATVDIHVITIAIRPALSLGTSGIGRGFGRGVARGIG